MTFSVLFWNIWLENQVRGQLRADNLQIELKRVVEQYQPDFIGLNEVMQAQQTEAPFIVNFLKSQCGYTYSYFAPASPFDDDWLIGTALCSRHKFDQISDTVISQDSPAKNRGYPGFEVKAITAKVVLPQKHQINIIVAHPLHLRKDTLRDHYEGTATLEKLIRSKEFSQNTILGGDFNEPGLMPKSFKSKTRDVLYSRTGSLTDTTWRHNAYRFTPIRANLDQLYWTKSSEFRLSDFEIIDSNISDHRPILAIFQY